MANEVKPDPRMEGVEPKPKAPTMANDPVYGRIRCEITDAYIAAGKPEPQRNWLYSRLIEVKFKAEQDTIELLRTLVEVRELGQQHTGDFRAGVVMAIEEIAERLGITFEVDDDQR